MTSKATKFAVIGAGHGGKAMAAHLSLMGYQVSLYNRTAERLSAIKARGGIDLESFPGGPAGFGALRLISSDIGKVIRSADVVMVVVPSSAHRDIAKAAARHLKEGQMVILHPGRTCGAIEFSNVLNQSGLGKKIRLGEAQSLIYASRSEGLAKARIFSIKDSVYFAALPASETREMLEVVNEAYPQFIDGGNVLQTGLDNMGAVFHPALTILNAGWIDSDLDFQFYMEGVSPSTSRVLEALDRERVTVAAALGIRAHTAMEWLKIAYNAAGSDLHEAVHNNPGYIGILAPQNLEHRYIFEDVPMSLVPLAALGHRYGVVTTAVDAVVNLASIIHRTDYWRTGRSLDKLGIDKLSVNELEHYVNEGTLP